MKNNLLYIFLCFLLVAFLIILPVNATTAESTEQVFSDESASNGISSYSADAAIGLLGADKLVDNIEAAFVYEVNTSTVMYSWNPDVQMAPSSLVKIMTALLAVEHGNLEDLVTVKQSVLDTVPYDAVSAELQPDEVLSLKDLVYCLLTGSANDAAAVIADYISGSQAEFVKLMNDRAVKIGCTNTRFTNAHGLHDESQLTTVRDVAKILSFAMKNDSFSSIFSSLSYTVPETNKSEERDLLAIKYSLIQDEMSNYYDDRVTGGRTGVAGDGTRCFAATAEFESMCLISVVMGCDSSYEEDGVSAELIGGFIETKTLLDAAFSGYKAVQVIFEGQALAQWDVPNGENGVTVCPNSAVSTVLPVNAELKDLNFKFSTTANSLRAPIQAGEKLCTAEIWFGTVCLGHTDLYAMNSVRENGYLSKESNEAGNNSGMQLALKIVFILMACTAFAVVMIRFVTKYRTRLQDKRNRQRRQDRRRSR